MFSSRLALVAAAFQHNFGRVHHRILPMHAGNYSTNYHDEIVSDVDDETMARHNTLSRRLYRILLRTCKQGVERANCGNSLDNLFMGNNNDNNGDKTWILLQPPMDQRKYGFAKIVEARRGKHAGEKEILSRNNNLNFNKATRRMSVEDVGMAMEVLRFVHISLGGNADDDLDEYYLMGNLNTSNGDGGDVANDDGHVEESRGSAAAGRHSKGHYTQFIDEDDERGEGDSNTKVADTTASEQKHSEGEGTSLAKWEENTEWDSDDSDDDDDALESDESVLVAVKDLQNAIRIAFRANLIPPSQSMEDAQPISTIIARRHRDAIDACSQLSEQFSMWGNKSSISIDWTRGVRVVATSSLMLKPTSGTKRYRFSYRIRVENISDIIDSHIRNNDSDGDECDGPRLEHRAVQLLGRTWIISENISHEETSSSILQRLFEQGITELNSESEDQGSNQSRIVQTVNEPKTGAGEI